MVYTIFLVILVREIIYKEMISLDKLKEIVMDASELMVTDGFDISSKEGYSNIVTSSDIAVQDYLCKHLAEAMPGSGFLCEEEDMHDASHEYTWIIDPIDGTANYSRGIAECAICVGLKHNSDMVMGVVYLPRAKEMFYAEKGKGAFLNGQRIHVSDRTFGNAIMCTALPVYHKEYAEICSGIIREVFGKCNDIRRFGACAPELCYLAMGRCELYFEYLLGGKISCIDGKRLDFVSPCGVIAGNSAENLDELSAIIRKHIG